MLGDSTAGTTSGSRAPLPLDAALLLGMCTFILVGGAQRVNASTFWPSGDSTFHLQNIFSVHHFLSHFAWGPLPYAAYPPGFYLLTHLCLTLFGDHLSSIAIAQGLAACALLVLAYFAGRDLGGRVAGLLGAAAIFGNIQIVDAVHQVYLDLPASAPFLLTVWALARAPKLDSRGWTIVACVAVATTILVRAGALPFLGLAVAYALLQALSPRHWYAMGISAVVAGFLGLRLSAQGKTENNALVPAAMDWAILHQGLIQWGGPILGITLAGGGFWLLTQRSTGERIRALASGSAILGITIAVLCGYFASSLNDMREYTRISLFTNDHMAFVPALTRIPTTFALTVLSIPVTLFASLEALRCLFSAERAAARVHAAAVVAGMGFVLAATDNWTRYSTPLIAPACVLAGAFAGRIPFLRWPLLFAALAQGTWLWIGWHWDESPGFQVSLARGQPRLELEAGEPFPWYGYATETEWPLSFSPVTEPFLMEDLYVALDARGDIDRCDKILFVDYWQSVEVRDFNYLLVRYGKSVDAALIGPDAGPNSRRCALVLAFDNPNLDLTSTPPDFPAAVAATQSQYNLSDPTSFLVAGHRTSMFIWPVGAPALPPNPGAPN